MRPDSTTYIDEDDNDVYFGLLLPRDFLHPKVLLVLGRVGRRYP